MRSARLYATAFAFFVLTMTPFDGFDSVKAGEGDGTLDLAELPTTPNWKPGTIRRDTFGRAIIQPDSGRSDVPQTSQSTATKAPADNNIKRIPAPAANEAVKRQRASVEIAEATPDSMRFAVEQVQLPALAKITATLEPGLWHQIPNTAISQVLATREMTPENGGVSGPASVVTAWNGAAFDGRYWYFHGGGHRDYSGNEVYAFDFVDLSWSRLTEPSPFVYENPKTGKWDAPKSGAHPCPRVPDLNGDGKFDAPVPGHTYDSIVYSPKTQSIFVWSQVPFCVGGNGWSGAPVWEFNPEDRSWTPHNPAHSKEVEAYRTADLDPATGNIILTSRNRLIVFDVESKEYTTMQSVQAMGSDGTGMVDPRRRLFFLNDRSGVRAAALGDGVRLGQFQNQARRPAFDHSAGAAYNARDRNLVYWSGDRRIFTLDPETNEWTLYENAGGPAPQKSRPYSKFLYLEDLDVFAAYGSPGKGVWLYRLPKEKPPVDPARVVRVCHGSSCAEFPQLNQAFKAAKDGAVITIGGAAFYESGILRANNVTIRGSKGTHLLETAAEGKASLVIKGNDTIIENIECSGIEVSDGNGACVRLEGDNLTLRNVYFHDSQEGLLTKSHGGGSIFIEDSKFERLGGACGIKCGRSHGIYIGRATELTVKRSVFLSSKDEGHAIKSRAARTTIENNVIASLDGKDSRLIDIPNGGEVIIRNNVLQKGRNSSNPDLIGIALELAYEGVEGHPVNSSLIEGNRVVIEPSDRQRTFVHSRDVPAPDVKANSFIGGEKPGNGENWHKTREDAGLGPYPALPKLE